MTEAESVAALDVLREVYRAEVDAIAERYGEAGEVERFCLAREGRTLDAFVEKLESALGRREEQ